MITSNRFNRFPLERASPNVASCSISISPRRPSDSVRGFSVHEAIMILARPPEVPTRQSDGRSAAELSHGPFGGAGSAVEWCGVDAPFACSFVRHGSRQSDGRSAAELSRAVGGEGCVIGGWRGVESQPTGGCRGGGGGREGAGMATVAFAGFLLDWGAGLAPSSVGWAG